MAGTVEPAVVGTAVVVEDQTTEPTVEAEDQTAEDIHAIAKAAHEHVEAYSGEVAELFGSGSPGRSSGGSRRSATGSDGSTRSSDDDDEFFECADQAESTAEVVHEAAAAAAANTPFLRRMSRGARASLGRLTASFGIRNVPSTPMHSTNK